MFDPLHQWFGIPSDQQPPTHYRLLGLEPTESDVNVIHAAADKQLAFLHQLTNGEHAAAAEALSNQVSAARLCLVSPEKKARYDASLQTPSVSPKATAPATPTPTPTPTMRVRRPGSPRRRSFANYWQYSAILGIVLILVILVGLKRGVISLDRDRAALLGIEVESATENVSPRTADVLVQPETTTDTAPMSPVVAPETKLSPEPTANVSASTTSSVQNDSLIDLMHPSVAAATTGKDTEPEDLEETSRTPIPTGEALEKRMALVSELYKDRYVAAKTSSERIKFATEMQVDGESTTDDPIGRFALWKVARDILVREGRFDLAMPIIDRLDQLYQDVPIEKWKAETLTASAAVVSGTEVAKFAAAAVDVMNDLADAEDFDTAIQLGDFTTKRFANRLARNRRDELASTLVRINTRTDRFQKYQLAMQTLESNPDDASANQTVGAYLCLVDNDWQAGLPRIASGPESPITTLARAELAMGDRRDAEPAAKVADDWYDLADKMPDADSRDAVRRHALQWYAIAQASAVGLIRKKIDLKVNELFAEYPDAFPDATIHVGGDDVAIAGVQVLDRQIRTGDRSRRDFASVNEQTFVVGMGPRPDGLGQAEAGLELRSVRQITVTGEASHSEMVTVDTFSKTGFVIDYHTAGGYTRRVFLGLGLAPGREFSDSPTWGTGTKPDVVTDIGKSDAYTIDLTRFAPSDWDGRCWFAVLMHNAGPDRKLTATVSW